MVDSSLPGAPLSRSSYASLSTALPWPLAVIDFEASSLDDDGYPIEVGLAFWPGPDEAISGWSTLIRPTGDWSRRGHWNLKSAKVHGILRQELLVDGQAVERVAAALNEMLGSEMVAWCDGEAHDTHWTDALFKAANATPLFHLGAWHQLIAMLSPAMRERGSNWLRQAPARHRAQADAVRLLTALAHAIGIKSITVQDLIPLTTSAGCA